MRIGQKTEAKLRSLCFVGTCTLLSVGLSHCKSTENSDIEAAPTSAAHTTQSNSSTLPSPAGGTPTAPGAKGTSTPVQNLETPAPGSQPSPKLTPPPKLPVAVANTATPSQGGSNALINFTAPLRFNKENLKEPQSNTGEQSIAQLFAETSRDEQLVLFPSAANGIQADAMIYQRRFSPESRFGLFLHNKNGADRSSDLTAQDSEIIRSIPTVFDAAVFCPLTQEVVFQAPPTDEKGKFLMEGRPRRIYLFSLKTGTLELVWRRDKERVGTLSPRMSATPDCQHLLVNLELESGAGRTPYGEILYLRRPVPKTGKDGKPKQAPEVDWSFSTMAESGKNGATKHYGEAIFVQPNDPKLYKPSAVPPAVFAVLDMVDKENSPTLYTFQPSGNSNTKMAGGIRWARTKMKADKNVRLVTQSANVNSADRVVVLFESRDENKNGHYKRGIATLALAEAEAGLKTLVQSDDYSIRSFGIAPQGDRLVASFVESKSASDVAQLADKRTAGIFELRLQSGSPVFSVIERMLPFQALSSHHNPRPQYSADGSTLFYGVPEIPELADVELFQLGKSSNRELQFPVKLFSKRVF